MGAISAAVFAAELHLRACRPRAMAWSRRGLLWASDALRQGVTDAPLPGSTGRAVAGTCGASLRERIEGLGSGSRWASSSSVAPSGACAVAGDPHGRGAVCCDGLRRWRRDAGRSTAATREHASLTFSRDVSCPGIARHSAAEHRMVRAGGPFMALGVVAAASVSSSVAVGGANQGSADGATDAASNRVFVTGLPETVSAEDVQRHFEVRCSGLHG